MSGGRTLELEQRLQPACSISPYTYGYSSGTNSQSNHGNVSLSYHPGVLTQDKDIRQDRSGRLHHEDILIIIIIDTTGGDQHICRL